MVFTKMRRAEWSRTVLQYIEHGFGPRSLLLKTPVWYYSEMPA